MTESVGSEVIQAYPASFSAAEQPGLVSVVIPAYNAEPWIDQAVESVVRERASSPIEVLVVDDGSEDDTPAVCRMLLGRHPDLLTLLRHDGGANLGVGASRNLGIASSRGEFICFLDADDFWLPGRLDRALRILLSAKDVEGVYETIRNEFEEGAPGVERRLLRAVKSPPAGALTRRQLLGEVLRGNSWSSSGLLLRRRALAKSGVFPPAFRNNEDLHLWARLTATCTLSPGSLDAPVAARRRHGVNVSQPVEGQDTFEVWWDLARWFERHVADPGMRRMTRDKLVRSISRSPQESVIAETALALARGTKTVLRFPRSLALPSLYGLARRIVGLHAWRVRNRKLALIGGTPRVIARKAPRDWGGLIAPELFRLISGTAPICVERNRPWYRRCRTYMLTGSVLSRADGGTVVWGAGFESAGDRVGEPPLSVCAVRGPLTRRSLLEQGIPCPEIFGDPALLYPRFYRPQVAKSWRLGIVPHWRDRRHPWVERLRHRPGVVVVNIQAYPQRVVDLICSCERVVSSSLYGLIVADAYGVPSRWIRLTEEAFAPHGGFKFLDYFASVGRTDRAPMVVADGTGEEELLRDFPEMAPGPDLAALWEACPFRTDGLPGSRPAIPPASEGPGPL